MSCKPFNLYGDPYDTWLYNYIQAIKYPTISEWTRLDQFCKIIDLNIYYRATDLEFICSCNVGDLISFPNRYYSWTGKYKVALNIAKERERCILILNSKIIGLNLMNINKIQSEILLPPKTYNVFDIEFILKVKHVHIE